MTKQLKQMILGGLSLLMTIFTLLPWIIAGEGRYTVGFSPLGISSLVREVSYYENSYMAYATILTIVTVIVLITLIGTMALSVLNFLTDNKTTTFINNILSKATFISAVSLVLFYLIVVIVINSQFGYRISALSFWAVMAALMGIGGAVLSFLPAKAGTTFNFNLSSLTKSAAPTARPAAAAKSTARFCTNCGYKIANPSASFCPSCGSRLNGSR